MGECKCSITSVLDCHEEHGISHCPRHSDANVARLEARVKVLEEGLRKYGKHSGPQHPHQVGYGCPAACTDDTTLCGFSHHCVCGLSTLLTTGGEG